jgi:hypothetical protein
VDHRRHVTGRLERSLTGPRLEAEHRLDDRLAFARPLDRGDLPDDPPAVSEPRELHDHVERRRHLSADVRRGQIHVGHHRHRLEAPQNVTGGVGVRRRERSLVTGVHRLQHVERLTPSDLPDDDPVGAHPKRVANQIAHRHLATSLHVRRTRFEGDDVRIRQTQLRCILDRDHPLVVADRRREDPEHRRLAAAGAAGHDHVGPPPHA